tara:strand:- start:454 stop:867 length:414 start_codon:yes stop_codon:yes gene_type:complete
MDAILALSFERRELENVLAAAEVSLPEPCRCMPASQVVILAAHALCHEDNAVSQVLGRQLDLLHARSVARLAARGLEAFLRPVLLQPEDLSDLGGRLWAIATSLDEGTHLAVAQVRSALAMGGIRLLAERTQDRIGS